MFEIVENVFIPFFWSLDPKEDHLSDKEADTFYPFLSIDDLSSLKSQFFKYYELTQDLLHFVSIWSH